MENGLPLLGGESRGEGEPLLILNRSGLTARTQPVCLRLKLNGIRLCWVSIM